MTTVERVQTGVRMERSVLKVLKGLAEYLDLSLGDLLEGIVLHAFEGEQAFGAPTLDVIAELKRIYGCDLTAADLARFAADYPEYLRHWESAIEHATRTPTPEDAGHAG